MSLFLDAPFPTGTDRCCLSRAESLRCTPLPIYVGPRRSGQSMPPVPSPQVYAESAESFGLVILAGSNLLRLHFRHGLPSAGPTHPCEGKSNCALFPGQCQSRKDRHPSHQRPCVRLLPRPTALPPMPFDERPLQPRCEVQRHHPRERRCLRRYIYILLRDGLPPVFNYIVLL